MSADSLTLIRILALCLVVALVLWTGTSTAASPASEWKSHKTVIGRAHDGDASISVVARLAGGNGFGYLTFIARYDGPLFSSEVVQDETTALFTFFSPDSGEPVKVFERGNLQVIQFSGDLATADIFYYFDDTPDGDFDSPESFSDGELIGVSAAAEYFLKTDLSTGVGMTTGSSRYRQLSSGTFNVEGKTYQFRRRGDRLRLFTFYSLDPEDPGALDFAGEEFFLGRRGRGN